MIVSRKPYDACRDLMTIEAAWISGVVLPSAASKVPESQGDPNAMP